MGGETKPLGPGSSLGRPRLLDAGDAPIVGRASLRTGDRWDGLTSGGQDLRSSGTETGPWLDAAAHAILPFSAVDWRRTPRSRAAEIPALALVDRIDPPPRTTLALGAATGLSRPELLGRIAAISIDSRGVDPEGWIDAVAAELGRRAGRPDVVIPREAVARFVAENASAVRRAIQGAFSARWEEDARFMADLMRKHPKIGVEELRRIFAKKRPHMTPEYCRALSQRLDASGQVTQERFDFWPDRPIDRMGPEPHFLFAAQLAYQLLDAPEGATYESVLKSWRHSWYPYWNLEECMDQRYQDADLLDGATIDLLRKAYPFIPEWPDGKRPDDAMTIDRLRMASAEPRPGGPDPFQASMLEKRLEALRRIPLMDEEYQWYAWSRIPPERGALEGAIQVETEHAITDKFAAKRFEILMDGARGEDTWNVMKSYSTDDAVADVLERSLGIHVIRAGKDDIIDRTKACISDRIAEGRGPILLHIQGVQVWGWVNEKARENPDVPIFGVSHTTSDRREYAEAGLEMESTLVEDKAGSDAKKIHEREMFARSFVHHVTGAVHDLNFAVKGHRFVVVGYGDIIGRAMWRALQGLPHTKSGGLVVYDPYLDPAVRKDAEAKGVVFIDDLEEELRQDRPHFIVECVGKKNVVERKHFEAMTRNCYVASYSTGSEAFAISALEELSRDEEGRPLRVADGRIGILPTYTYEVPDPNGSRKVTVIGAGSVANFAKGASNITSESVFNNVMVLDSKRRAVFDWHLDRRGVRRHEPIRFEETEQGDLERFYRPRWDPTVEDSRDPLLYVGRNRFLDDQFFAHHPWLQPGMVFDESDPFSALQKAMHGGGYQPEVHRRALEMRAPAGLTPRLSAVETSGARALEVASWRELIEVMELRAARGELGAVAVDLDNVLFRPRGYLGSEQQEWDSVAALGPEGRRRVLDRRDVDEARMLQNRFFDRPGKLTPELVERLFSIASTHGIPLVGVSARPGALREHTLEILRSVGIEPERFSEILFTAGRGEKKTRALTGFLSRVGVDPTRAMVVDDLDENLSGPKELGAMTARLASPDPNFAGWTSYQYLRIASHTTHREDRFEYLLNAFAASRSDGEARNVEGMAERLLEPKAVTAFRAEIAGLRGIVHPR